jgi:hypothetical protein
MPELVTTFYAAVPVAKRDDGWLACDYTEAIVCQSAEEAVQIAAMIARKPGYAAAVAFSRTRDPATGQYDDAEILARAGDLYWCPKRRAWVD